MKQTDVPVFLAGLVLILTVFVAGLAVLAYATFSH